MRTRSDDAVKLKLSESPLCQVLFDLVELIETDSQESQLLEKEKHAVSPVVATSTMPAPDLADNPLPETPSTPPPRQPHFPPSDEPVSHKRKISEVSLPSSSTETTPSKLARREALVQSIQNSFVSDIVKKLWLGEIGIPWADNRHMFLSYQAYSLFNSLLTVANRKCPFSIASGTVPTKRSRGE
jgi:hypothetical protein